MVELVEPSWLEQHLNDSNVATVDPRPVVKYLEGHIPRAVNIPLPKMLDSRTLALLPTDQLCRTLGASGIDEKSTTVLYDGYDGQSASMLAWILEYLGQKQVAVLSRRVEGWAGEGRELLYKPVTLQPKQFDPTINEAIRIFSEELVQQRNGKILDLRSKDEFEGRVATEVRTGHIPRARNVPWTDLIGDNHTFLRSRADLEEVVERIDVNRTDNVVTYCGYGPRAAIGYVALQSLGFKVKVYDGSFHQWAQDSRLPLEGEGLQISL